jgi:hypothetical protein
MLTNKKHCFKIQLEPLVIPPITQRVLVSVPGCVVPPCPPPEDICSSPFIGTLYTTYMGSSLIVGAQIFEDEEATIPLTESLFTQVRTQLEGEAPNSTIVNFNLGEVTDVLFTCT